MRLFGGGVKMGSEEFEEFVSGNFVGLFGGVSASRDEEVTVLDAE